MIASQIPEIFYGGYWYVAPLAPDTDMRKPAVESSYCAWYADVAGSIWVAVRTTSPIVTLNTASQASVRQILEAAGYQGKPFGRLEGF